MKNVARKELDNEIALKRLAKKGITLTTIDCIIFELCQTANRKEFRLISKLVKESLNINSHQKFSTEH